jgi:ferritin-like metal-binding protein YciE
MELSSLRELYIDVLNELYSLEQHLIRLVMEMASESAEPLLKKRFELHYTQTYDQLMRMERVLRVLQTEPTGKLSNTAQGLIDDADRILASPLAGGQRDAALLAVAQRIEHLEIASYSTARDYAEVLGEESAVRVLQRTLDEEIQEEKLLRALTGVVVKYRTVGLRRTPFHDET